MSSPLPVAPVPSLAEYPVEDLQRILENFKALEEFLRWTQSAIMNQINSASPTLARGDMIMREAPVELGGLDSRLPAGTEGQILTMVNGVPTWVSADSTAAATAATVAALATLDPWLKRQAVEAYAQRVHAACCFR